MNDKNAYQKLWRKQEKLLKDLLANVSSDEESQTINSSDQVATVAQPLPVVEVAQNQQHVDELCNRDGGFHEQDGNHYSDVISDESEGSDCEGVLNLLGVGDHGHDINVDIPSNKANISTQLAEWILRNKIIYTNC